MSIVFEKSFVEVLDTHAPKKKKFLCGNQKPYVNKTLRSEIMKRSQLKTRNATRCNNRDDLLHLIFTPKISIFFEACIKPNRISVMELLL